ncbi:hypothetical protein JCM10207_000193 [Rhodosporidiobolus poonsookiae]
MEPQCTTGPEDHLSRLPAELLTRIFELAYEDEHTTTGPLSRALLPFDRIERFKVVEVASKKQLEQLTELVILNPYLPSSIKTIDFAFANAKEEPVSLHEHFDPARFFSSMPRLASLAISGPSSIFDLVLDSAFGRICPPRLASVSLVAPAKWESPSNPEHFRHLCSIPSITSLTLDIRRIDDRDLDEHQSEVPTRLCHLTHLSLKANGNQLSLYASLARACPALKAFHIDDAFEEPDFSDVLGKLAGDLEDLKLETVVRFDDYSEPCDQVFPHFTQLTDLYLGEGIFDHNTLFFNLCLLPSLTRFTLARGAIVEASDLLSLVSGLARHPSLKILRLDMLSSGKRGYRIIQDGKGTLHPSASSKTTRVAPDWVVPEFTGLSKGRFSVEAVEQLVHFGAQDGIRVEGSAVKGIDFYREWMSEATDCLIAWGRLQGDYGELRAFLGGEAAEQLLRERGIKA